MLVTLSLSFSIDGVDFKNLKSSSGDDSVFFTSEYFLNDESAVVLDVVLIVLSNDEILEWHAPILMRSTPILYPRLSFIYKH